ncbi:MAG: VCBS repeat-containing protein, partial [Phycisphaerales bacterium]|nr:VCBS repeat-containing protein [Phycisphaerales bacterium]
MPGTSTRLSLFGLLVLGPVVSAGAADVTFSNQTVAAGVNVTHSTSGFAQVQYSGGATVGDFNGDGWQDLFVLSGGNNNQPDRLFINNGDGTFTNQAAAWNLTAVHKGKAACVGDFNGDGNLDLYVLSAGPAGGAAAVGHHKLYRNNGNNTFTNVAAVANVATVNPNYPDGWTCCFGDYDRDGDLDLFVGGFSTNAPSNIGSRLFRNDGGLFTDVTNASQLFIGVGPIALQSASFSDMTGDGYPELLLVGDFKGANFVGSRYMHNNGDGTFSDMTNVADCGDEENGMGQCRGDFDNDGRLDWYATSIFLPQIGWTGNKLYRNVADDQFDEYGVSAGVVDGGYGWGASAVDFNHDTWLDIAETNGDSASGGTFYQEQSYLYMNDGDNTFTERAVTSGLIHNGKGRSLVHLDYDNDGDQDVVISANNEPLNLYRNDLPFSQTTHWLRIFLD